MSTSSNESPAAVVVDSEGNLVAVDHENQQYGLRVSDLQVLDKLTAILGEMRVMNAHLSKISGLDITVEEAKDDTA